MVCHLVYININLYLIFHYVVLTIILYICVCASFVDFIVYVLFVGRGQSITCDNFLFNPLLFLNKRLLNWSVISNHPLCGLPLNIASGKQSEDLPYLYWIPKLHKTPYKERYIAYHQLVRRKNCYSPDKDYVCSKRGTTEILWNCLLA